MPAKACPCTSGQPYKACCARFHEGKAEAETPTLLMRSRFSAFALGEAEYLWRTLDPLHTDLRRPKDELVADIRRSCRDFRYMRLTILDARDDRVLFVAAVFRQGQDRSFAELSSFVREGTGWRYADGVSRPVVDLWQIEGWTIDSFGDSFGRPWRDG